jgi:hypothetical protein
MSLHHTDSRGFRIFILVIFACACSTGLWAQCPALPAFVGNATQLSDQTFLRDVFASNFAVQSLHSSDVPNFNVSTVYNITRVVGPGAASEFDSSGFLTQAAWNTYVANGVLSADAYVDVAITFLDDTWCSVGARLAGHLCRPACRTVASDGRFSGSLYTMCED